MDKSCVKRYKTTKIKKKISNHNTIRKKNIIKPPKSKFIIQKQYKIIFIIITILIHVYCNYYSKQLLNYYYITRLQKIKKWKRHYNESNLITFEDKINWLAIHDVNKLKGKCADKISLHQYSKRVLKKDICNKIIKIYDDPYKINITELPEKFVLKTNQGSGFNIIVHNKTELNVNWAKNKLYDWLQVDFGKVHCEHHYSYIERKAFAEENIGKDINNYKFMCYNGEPKFIYINKKINKREYQTFFDINWNKLDFYCASGPYPKYKYPKPLNYTLMIKYARKLSKPFKFVRVDLYENNGDIRLGELTFTPFNSHLFCRKPEHNIELGKYITIP